MMRPGWPRAGRPSLEYGKRLSWAVPAAAAPITHPVHLQCGVPGLAGLHGPHAQRPVVEAIINAHVPAPALRPPQARTSVLVCTQRRRCVLHRLAQVLSTSGRGWGAPWIPLMPTRGGSQSR